MSEGNETASNESDRHGIRQTAGLIELDGLTRAKPVVLEAIGVLEQLSYLHFSGEDAARLLRSEWWIYAEAKNVQQELQEFIRSPRYLSFRKLSAIFWRHSICARRATIMFCRELSPLATTLFHWSAGAKVFSERLAAGILEDDDFPKLTAAAGKLAGAPIRICDARTPDMFLRVLFETHTMFDYAVCDWTLDEEEVAGACRMTSDSRIKFLFPSPAGSLRCDLSAQLVRAKLFPIVRSKT